MFQIKNVSIYFIGREEKQNHHRTKHYEEMIKNL